MNARKLESKTQTVWPEDKLFVPNREKCVPNLEKFGLNLEKSVQNQEKIKMKHKIVYW